MKRLHVHIAVADLDSAIRFYSGLFAQQPSVQEHDYAKWQLDDPRVNFAISARGKRAGLRHLGIEAADPAELREIQGRLEALDGKRHDEQRTTCCYSVSDKSWQVDPAGVSWELFHTLGRAEQFGQSGPDMPEPEGAQQAAGAKKRGGGCCG